MHGCHSRADWPPKSPPSCSSDDGCQKSHFCSGGKCKPLKKANEWCPRKEADIFNCGCIEGYYCKPYELHKYWGKCEEEESGSGLEA
ncbi:hypothetical protein OS493_034801 [Desmophyllum pertusum]|uniref:Uncharacterized protein n=1 Tax=Desmophyllum pertusum TaxID=174260 RepID=A0A9W9YIM2_9CNID|nr:hypothetical protein OS493_034801 [Desmophyllum pertusum]